MREQARANPKATGKYVVESLVKKTSTVDASATISDVLPKMIDDRSEVFAMRGKSCYFINSRAILDKKKINASMKIDGIMHLKINTKNHYSLDVKKESKRTYQALW